MRLDKFISSQKSDLSRSQIRELCKKGLVCVDGQIAKKSDLHINPDKSCICVNGEEIRYRKFVYIMLNKPQGVVCSTKDGISTTVLEIIPDELRRNGLFPAGRLDKDTEGFVLLTDDGVLAHKILSPKTHVPKTYFVRLEKPWEDSYVQIIKDGMTIDGDEKCLPAEFIGSDNPLECQIILHEGKYHQVKRMFETLGNKVVYLKRTAIGRLDLDENLALGECLDIMHKDVEKLLML